MQILPPHSWTVNRGNSLPIVEAVVVKDIARQLGFSGQFALGPAQRWQKHCWKLSRLFSMQDIWIWSPNVFKSEKRWYNFGVNDMLENIIVIIFDLCKIYSYCVYEHIYIYIYIFFFFRSHKSLPSLSDYRWAAGPNVCWVLCHCCWPLMMKMYLSMSGPCWKKLAFCAFQIVPVPWDVPRHTNVFLRQGLWGFSHATVL